MRRPRLQFKVRGLMILVAVVGLLSGAGIWGVKLVRLSAHYRATEAGYAQAEKIYSLMKSSHESSLRWNKRQKVFDERIRLRNRSLRQRFPMPELDMSIDYDRWIEEDMRGIEHCRQLLRHATLLRQKYARAASRPWEPLPPDPPTPVEPAPSPPHRAPEPPVTPRLPPGPTYRPPIQHRLTMAVPVSHGHSDRPDRA